MSFAISRIVSRTSVMLKDSKSKRLRESSASRSQWSIRLWITTETTVLCSILQLFPTFLEDNYVFLPARISTWSKHCLTKSLVCILMHIGTLHCCVQYSSRNNYSVVNGRGSRNSVNPRMSLCPARVWFRDSANVSPSSAGIPKRKPMRRSPKWIAFLFSWGTEHWLMDRYPLHRQFIPAHGKLMPVKLGGRCINLSTGTWEINAGQIRGPVQWFIKPAHGKLMQVKLGCLRINLLTGFWHWVRFILYFLESTFHL